MRKTLTLLVLIISTLHAAAEAALLSRLGGAAVYDTVRNITWIAVRKGGYLRNFAYRFIELCNPELSESRVRSASALTSWLESD